MNKINLIFLICLLNPSLILMLNNKYGSLKSSEYSIDTCCSLNSNEKLYLSCGQNEKIHLNLIEIYYNSDEYCSSELYCCKYRTKCSRRITKYSSLNCDEKSFCYIDKSCLKIYHSCSSLDGLYGQYLTINYSCLTRNETENIFEYNNEESIPFIVKLSTSNERRETNDFIKRKNSFENFLIKKDFKSSPLFLISIICLFLLLMFFIYYLADQIGKKICRKNSLKKNSFETKIHFQHLTENKTKVQSTPSLPITRVYPSNLNSYYRNNPYLNQSYRKSIHVQQNPFTQQIYSRTFYPYLNSYRN